SAIYYKVGGFGAGWNTELVEDSSALLGSLGLDMALDSNDFAHIVYYEDIPTGDLRYATNLGGSWDAIILDDEDDTGTYPAIAVDHNDVLHVSYYKYSGALLYL